VKYQVEAHSLADASLSAVYPMPDIPDVLPPWTGFGQQLSFDAATGRGLVLAPSATPPPGPNPFPYKLWAVDTKRNQASVLRDLGNCTPVAEGYPATVDPKNLLFWTIIGDPSFERKLVGIDLDTGATKVNSTVWLNTSLYTFAFDKKSQRLWGVGNPNVPLPPPAHGHKAGPILLLEMDPTSGAVLAQHDAGLGDGWLVNELPGEGAFDEARGEFVLTAEKKAGNQPADPPYVALVRIPVAAPSTARTTARFCSLDEAAYTCPKVLAHRFSA